MRPTKIMLEIMQHKLEFASEEEVIQALQNACIIDESGELVGEYAKVFMKREANNEE